jgi:hypothetical protein
MQTSSDHMKFPKKNPKHKTHTQYKINPETSSSCKTSSRAEQQQDEKSKFSGGKWQ